MNTNKQPNFQGFSFIELMVVVSIIGVLAAVSVPVLMGAREGAKASKLSSEVATLNSAVKSLVASGGEIDTDNLTSVLKKLKAAMAADQVKSHVGFSGAFVDYRLTGKPIDANTEGPRVVWNNVDKRFEITEDSVAGFHAFFLDNNASQVGETRLASAPFKYSSSAGWVWGDYDKAAPKLVLGPSIFTRSAGVGGTDDPILVTFLFNSNPAPEINRFEPQPEDPNRLRSPIFSVGGGRFALSEFQLPLQLQNPNSTVASAILYRFNSSGGWNVYNEGSIINITPDTLVDAYVIPGSEETQYTESNVASATYGTEPVNLELSLHADKTSVRYFDLVDHEIMVRWKVTNLNDIPDYLKAGGFFSTYYTTDNTDPAFPANRSTGVNYTADYNGEMMMLNPSLWGDKNTFDLIVYAEAKTAKWINHSDKPITSISAVRESLPSPEIEIEEVGEGVFEVTFVSPRELPAGAGIYYNTSGETMEQNPSTGNVAQGTLYTGPFLWEPEPVNLDFGSNGTVNVDRGNGDVTIERVVIKSNGVTMAQNESVAFDDDPQGNGNGYGNPPEATVHDSSSSEVTLESITINDNGTPIIVNNLNALDLKVKNLNVPSNHADHITSSENGVETGNSGDSDFGDQIEDMLKSKDLRDYVKLDGLPSGMSFGFDVSFSALRNDDYLVVMERSGNSTINLEALDAAGAVIPDSNEVSVREYSWNTGHAPSDSVEQPMFLAVVDIEQFGVDTDETSITGFRVNNEGGADFKFFTISSQSFEDRPVHFEGAMKAAAYPPVELANWFTPSVPTAIHVSGDNSDEGNGNDGNGHSNNGHGNNTDGVDISNPGQGHGGPNGQVDPSGDVDDENGNGNGGGGNGNGNGGYR